MRRLSSLTSGRRVVLLRVLLALALTPRVVSADWPTFGRAVAVAPGEQIGPAIAPDGAGGAIVAWHDRRVFPFNIDAQHVLASGEVDPAWPANGRALLTDALIQTIVPQGVEFPRIVSDGAGGAIVSWPDGRSTVNGLDIYAHHVLASGVVDPAWPVNGTTVCSAIREQANPSIISDGAGGAFIAWDDNRPGTTLNDRDIFAQHVLASGLVDPAWPANGTAVVTAPKAQISPALVGDGGGGIIVTWNDLRSGNPGIDMFAQHVLASGAVDPAWPADGLALSAAPGSQVGQSVVSDGGNGAYVAWTDTRDGTNQIFAQRVLSSGAIAPGWPTNGLAISIGGTDEVSPTLASDGAGGAIVAWGGGNSGHHNMLAQHLLGSGVLDPAWPVGGAHLGFANSEQTTQDMASDGAGGAIVAWQQGNEVTGFDIFAQHVLASGALDSAYPASGRAVCALLGLQHEPSIVAAGVGGAIVTWEDTRNDSRNGTNDIFALQVLFAGTTGVPDTSPPRITFARPHPNPATELATLRFTLPRAARVRLAIYDIAGRRVRDLVSGVTPAGDHATTWDLRDDAGRPVGAGLYFARLETEGRTFTEKLTALR
jgi:hypothetical protein